MSTQEIIDAIREAILDAATEPTFRRSYYMLIERLNSLVSELEFDKGEQRERG